jgi:hypothetical protein
MMQLIAINNSEAETSRTSGRGDTSQMGNWFNFRNCKFTANRATTEITIDKEFVANVPLTGTVDFDYVSTARPPPEVYQSDKRKRRAAIAAAAAQAADDDDDDEEEEEVDEVHIDGLPNSGRAGEGLNLAEFPFSQSNSRPGTGNKGILSKSALRPNNVSPNTTLVALPLVAGANNGSKPGSGGSGSGSATGRAASANALSRPTTSSGGLTRRKIRLVSDEEFFQFMQQLGLSNRSKVATSNTIFVLMDLQLASTKHYFRTSHILLILDAFQDDWEVQTRIIVALFSRILDLHNMDLVLRNLDRRAQQEIIRRLGYLNVINPLKISFDYVLCLKYLDNRVLLIALMELAAIESADQIAEEPNTELPIATLYGSYTRALNEIRPETMRFSFSDFGVRTNNISWSTRREMIKKFLVGSQPIDDEMYGVISLWKELEANGALSRGPIDLQYASYQKSMRTNASRTMKLTKSMVNAMRNVANSVKK